MRHIAVNVRMNAFFYLTAILFALALKQHYSQARAEDLVWVLKPTAGLVSIINGDTFVFEAGAGYVCNARRVIIAPACAGVNFMIMTFGMAVFTGLHHMRGRRHRLAWLFFSLLTAYVLTLGVNTLRIMVSIYTFNADFLPDGLAWSQVHRLEGVVIYFFFQYLFYSMIKNIIGRYSANIAGRESGVCAACSDQRIQIRKTVFRGLIPCVWYLGVTIAVPFLNNAADRYGVQFYNHAAIVLGLCLMTWICVVLVEICGQGITLMTRNIMRYPG